MKETPRRMTDGPGRPWPTERITSPVGRGVDPAPDRHVHLTGLDLLCGILGVLIVFCYPALIWAAYRIAF